ncbi:gamma-aminobutyric acid type B receptor subunit 2 [Tribolium castaneum]|uniref:Gamma-aminobutyric acid type B receptor subunit 2 n=1 Tax=Tribolium castaneum TaxID=7070 RepID=D2A100_TRICA|nr:PREDICTED: gamma-aminobutyric acid type B receptor subunit 2 isoform X1 [Tribolium castaneum]EFA01604.1 Gamma-aminobutyric acid type B receptor subunit 2-like Protein [Tribolium castaneum]|eukprot:XP_973965.1 PREDICTED: gamma-aminobutyric acid type B receptor subunit 2 isoform X1 [Tribolium castaneum]
MWPPHSFQRHLCVIFLTSAIIASLFVIKNSKTQIKSPQHALTTFHPKTPLHLRPEIRNKTGEIIHILGLFELTTKWGRRPEGLSEIAAAELAIKHVNRFNILPEYTLKLIINDTQCDPGVGIDRFFHAIYSKKTIVMLLGTSCSNVTESLAHVVPYWNILQVSFGSTSPTLSDRKKFPLFFRTVAPDSSHNAAKVNFVKHFGWRVIATFCQSENKFLLPLNNLITHFENENISCVTTITFSLDNYKEQLKVLKNSDIRIIIGALSSELAPAIFCEIYNLGMYGPDYVWILQDRQEVWWNVTTHCVSLELSKSVEGIILVSDYNIVGENNTSISGLDNARFESKLNVSKVSKYASLAYDAIWAMALSLKDVLDFGQEFNYRRSDIVCEFVLRMSSLNFMGISGPLKFIGADRVGSSVLRQIQDGHVRDIALFDSDSGELDFECKGCSRVSWWNTQTPIAQRILKVSLITIPKALFYFVIFVAIMGILFAVLFLYFNLHFRRMKSVKLSSPKLNNVAVVGCILVYLSVILLGFDTSTVNKYVDELCTVQVYLLSAGFSLVFGSMFAKTYRVHRIFTHSGGPSKVKDKLLKDKQLIVLILVPLIIDAIILALWVMIDPLERQLYNLTLEINSEERGVVYQPQVQVCRSQNTSGWFVAVYGYKGLILIMGVFMAWETRHVKVQALNDSQYIGICVYSAVFSAIITVLTSFISEYVIFSYLARTLSILTSTTLTLFLLFSPKLKSVFGRYSSQDPIMQSMGLKIEYNTRRFIKNDPKEQILRLEIQNKVYKCELAALDLEITRLEGLLQLSRRSSEGGIFTIYKDDRNNPEICFRKEEWASWPTQFSKTHQEFASENKLNNENQQKSLIDEMKCFFNKTMQISPNTTNEFIHNDFLKLDVVEQRHKSNPEFFYEMSTLKDNNLARAKSELNVTFFRSFR